MALNILTKLKNKYFLSLAGNGIMAVLGMASAILLYRALPIKELGVWVFFTSTLMLVDTARAGFIIAPFIKFYSGTEKARSNEVVGSTWMLAYLITGAVVVLNGIGLLFANKVNDPGLAFFMKWFGLTCVASLPYFMASCVVQAEQRFDRLLYIRFINQGMFIIMVILMIITKKATIQNVIYANILSAAVTSAYTMIKGWSMIRTVRYKTSTGLAEMFHFGKYSVGTDLSSILFRNSDTYIINFMLGPAALAIYNLGTRLMILIEIPLNSFAATGMPELAAAYNNNDKSGVIQIMKKYTGMITWALLPICLLAVVFADVAINIIGGSKYVHTEAANVLRVFMTFALLFPVDRFLALTLNVIHKPKLNFIKLLLMLAANIIFDFVGIYAFGNVYGVALATIVPTIIAIAIGYWGMNKYYPFKLLDIYKVGYREFMLLLSSLKMKLRKTA
ncbi:MAG: oligosaccharide flippase family protein [Taibaiella sp.]|nr:oligosaccharide flippase family protein [Taibaiella sp.]